MAWAASFLGIFQHVLTAAFPLLFVSLGWFLQESANQLTSVVLFFISLILLFQIKKLDKKYLKVSAVAFLIPLAYLISALINSVDLKIAWMGTLGRHYGIGTFLALAILFLAAAVKSNEKNRIVDIGLGTTLALAVIYGSIQICGLDPMPWNNPFPGISLSLGNPNFAGALLGMLIVVPLTWAQISQSRVQKYSCYLMLVVLIYLGFRTYSIQFFGLAILASSIFFYLASKNSSQKKYLLSYISSFGLLFSSYLILGKNENLLVKLKDSFVTNANVNQRLGFWQTGIDIWKDHPIFGVGPDQFQNYAGLYRTSEQLLRDGAMVLPDKAHNVFIDYLANAGIFGGILWLVSTLYISTLVIKVNKLRIDTTERVYCSTFSAIWFAYIAQSLISPDQIILTSLGYISAGIIFGIYVKNNSPEVQKQSTKVRINQRVFAAFATIAAVFFYSQYLFYSAESRKVLLSDITEPTQILKVLDGWPNPSGLESLAVGLSQNPSNCSFVGELTQRLLLLNDRSSQAWFINGGCSYSQGKYEQANAQLENALKFDPLNTTYLMGHFQTQMKLNNFSEAEKTLTLLKETNPSANGLLKMEQELISLK